MNWSMTRAELETASEADFDRLLRLAYTQCLTRARAESHLDAIHTWETALSQTNDTAVSHRRRSQR